MGIRFVRCLAAVVITMIAAMTNGQNMTAATPQTLHVTSRIVILDVVVTDKSGKLINNLRREDFTITENGRPATVNSFEAPSSHFLAPGPPIDSTAALARRAPQSPVDIVVLDELNTGFQDMAFARYALEKYLKSQPATLAAPTMLLAVSSDRFQVLRDYTQDRAAILTALNHHLTAYPWHLQVGFSPLRQLAISLSTLEHVAQATSGHPGHKNVVWIGRGFPGIDLSTGNVDSDGAGQISAAIATAVNRLRDSRITLYTIDPTALSSSLGSHSDDASSTGDTDSGDAADPFAGDVNFAALAPATGGKAFYSRNDVDREIGQSVRDGVNYYTLSYRPPSDSDDSQPYRKTRIHISQPGLHASFREGYYAREVPGATSNPITVTYDMYAAETGSLIYTGLSITAALKPATLDTYVVTVPERELAWTDGDREQSANLSVVAAALNAKGQLLRRATVDFTARRPAGSDAPDAATQFEIHLAHALKTTRLRFVMRVADGRIGTADLSVDAAKPAPVLHQ